MRTSDRLVVDRPGLFVLSFLVLGSGFVLVCVSGFWLGALVCRSGLVCVSGFGLGALVCGFWLWFGMMHGRGSLQ